MERSQAIWQSPDAIEWSRLLMDSYEHWTSRVLVERGGGHDAEAQRLFEAPRVVVSHGCEPDPLFNYANQRALDLWETTWGALIGSPSRHTAEPVNQAEREAMLACAAEQGYLSDYRGVRCSTTGQRFLVEQAVVWNVVDGRGVKHGQAATFLQWTFLDPIAPGRSVGTT